jgi:hypothetical protein
MVRDQDGDDPWPGAVGAFRQPELWPPILPAAYSPTGREPVETVEFWAAFKVALADAIANGSISSASLATWSGLNQPHAPAEAVDEVLRGLWYDLWGLEPVPGASADVPWFLPGYTVTGYTLFLESQKGNDQPLTQSQQDWINERGLVWMRVPDHLVSDLPSYSYLNPDVLEEAAVRVGLGWLRKT